MHILSSALLFWKKKVMEKKRGQNWGVDEEVALIEEVKARATVLFGSFKGCGIKKGRKMKEREWQKIADRLNS